MTAVGRVAVAVAILLILAALVHVVGSSRAPVSGGGSLTYDIPRNA